jgi:phage terminase small subunit
MSLHWRKRLFIEEYVAHPELNAAEVAVRVGFEKKYAKNRAWELLNNPEVKAAIEHKQRDLLEKISLTAEDVVKDIMATRQRCVEAGDGAWQTQGRLKCDELLGKYLGMWQEKVEGPNMDELVARLKVARKNAGLVQVGGSHEYRAPVLIEAGSATAPKSLIRNEDAPVDYPARGITSDPPPEEPEDWVAKLC